MQFTPYRPEPEADTNPTLDIENTAAVGSPLIDENTTEGHEPTREPGTPRLPQHSCTQEPEDCYSNQTLDSEKTAAVVTPLIDENVTEAHEPTRQPGASGLPQQLHSCIQEPEDCYNDPSMDIAKTAVVRTSSESTNTSSETGITVIWNEKLGKEPGPEVGRITEFYCRRVGESTFPRKNID